MTTQPGGGAGATTTSAGGDIIPQMVEIGAVHGDLRPDVVKITVDRLTLILERHVSKVERSNEWIAPTGVFISIVLTYVTASFHDALNVKADTWSAIFLLLGVASAIWLGFTLRRIKAADSVDDLVSRIKSGNCEV